MCVNVYFKVGNVGLSASAESVHHVKRPSRRGSRHGHVHRSSSRRNKENGSSRSNSFRNKNATAKGSGSGGASGSATSDANNLGNSSVANVTAPKEHNRIRKQRAVSFEQTSALTGTTMTTSASGCPMLVVGPMINPKWHEHTSKSLDEKKLLSKQNNIGGAGPPLMDGDTDLVGEDQGASCGPVEGADSDGDWHMMDQSQTGQTQSQQPTPSSLLHHFKPPRI